MVWAQAWRVGSNPDSNTSSLVASPLPIFQAVGGSPTFTAVPVSLLSWVPCRAPGLAFTAELTGALPLTRIVSIHKLLT